MFTICKEFAFSASHQLLHLPAEHPCARLHGHNYCVRVTLAAPSVGDEGFVVDFRALDSFKRMIDDVYDHRHLNDVVGDPSGRYTTSELLARRFYLALRPEIPAHVRLSVEISETPKTWARYDPDPGDWQ